MPSKQLTLLLELGSILGNYQFQFSTCGNESSQAQQELFSSQITNDF